MFLDLSGARALVTGGERGIGKAISEALAASGARLAINYRSNSDAAEALGRELGERHFEHMLLRADVSQERAVHTMLKRIEESWGGLDVLILNAGIWHEGELGKLSLAEWKETININLTGAFIVANEALRLMVEAEPTAPKRIIFVASTSGLQGETRHSHYAASKGGLLAMMKSLAVELAPQKITVNAVAPGWVNTDMTASLFRETDSRTAIEQAIPLGRFGTSEEVAAAVVFLASRQASYVTGSVLTIDGGSTLA